MRFRPLLCSCVAFLAFRLANSFNSQPVDVTKTVPKTETVSTCTMISRRSAFIVCGIAGAFVATNKSMAADNRRQLELCLVAIQRVNYWAQRQANDLADKKNERRRLLYLESRLGAKAILTSRVGPGSTGTVYTLSTLRLPECLADLEWHAAATKSPSTIRKVTEAKERFTEALASIVEFDGLETLTDPSPRSALTMAQYTDTKADYVVRALRELVLPNSQELLTVFGPEALERSRKYIEQYFATEIPQTGDRN